jgi:hypothetical protein
MQPATAGPVSPNHCTLLSRQVEPEASDANWTKFSAPATERELSLEHDWTHHVVICSYQSVNRGRGCAVHGNHGLNGPSWPATPTGAMKPRMQRKWWLAVFANCHTIILLLSVTQVRTQAARNARDPVSLQECAVNALLRQK